MSQLSFISTSALQTANAKQFGNSTHRSSITANEPLTKSEILAHTSRCEGNPSIYLGTYQKYSNGSLFGQWIDLTTFDSYEEFCTYCRRLHYDEYNPEFMVQDFEEYPKAFYHEAGLPTETEFNTIKEIAELDDTEKEAYKTICEWAGEQISIEEFRNRYVGEYNSGEDFAFYWVQDSGYLDKLPEVLQCAIDYAAVWRYLYTSGSYEEQNGFVFLPY